MITIVGAGGHGLSLAYHMIKKGEKKVRIIEQKRIGYGSSSRNASRYRYNFYDENNIKFALEGIPYAMKLAKEEALNPLFMRTGYLWILEEKGTKPMQDLHALWSKYGVQGRFTDCHEFGIHWDKGCYFAPKNGSFHHDYMLWGMYESIRDKIEFLNDTVVRIKTGSGRVKGVETQYKGYVETEHVAITAGAWSGQVMESLGINLPIYPDRREAFITQDVKFRIKPLVIDNSSGVYFSHTLKGEIIGGIERSIVGFREFSTSFESLAVYLRRLRELVPSLGGIGILRSWSGYYEMTADHSHIMGFDPSWPEGLYIDAGYSGHGMMFSPYAGKIMSELILDGKRNPFIDIFSPSRFSEGKLLRENLVI